MFCLKYFSASKPPTVDDRHRCKTTETQFEVLIPRIKKGLNDDIINVYTLKHSNNSFNKGFSSFIDLIKCVLY